MSKYKLITKAIESTTYRNFKKIIDNVSDQKFLDLLIKNKRFPISANQNLILIQLLKANLTKESLSIVKHPNFVFSDQALHSSLYDNHLEVTKVLLDKSNDRTKGTSYLQDAVQDRQIETIKLILSSDKIDIFPSQVIQRSVQTYSFEILELIVNDKRCYTEEHYLSALMMAINNGFKDMVVLLAKNKKIVNILKNNHINFFNALKKITMEEAISSF